MNWYFYYYFNSNYSMRFFNLSIKFCIIALGTIYIDTNSLRDYINKVLTKAESMASSGQNPSRDTFLAAIEEDMGSDQRGIKFRICHDI